MIDLNGKKVKIKTDEMLRKNKYAQRFIEFIEKNKHVVFTAKLEISRIGVSLYSLDEDNSYPKWLFISDDLEVIEN